MLLTNPAAEAVECHMNAVPDFVGPEIDRLYGHLFCSFCNFHALDDLSGVSTYVVRRDGVPITVFLFRLEASQVTVISEFIKLGSAEIQRFADTMFGKFPSVQRICFNKIEQCMPTASAMVRQPSPYPTLRLNRTEDIVVKLPASVAQYQASLGKNMRRNIKRYSSTLEQDFPSYQYRVYIADEISEQDVRAIIKLNWARMAGKNIVSRIDEDETQWVIALAKQRGIVGVATIEGVVCGGAIGFRIGDDYFMHIIAHDPAYNDYSLGILCYYLTICEGIARGGRQFHLLSGRYEYKFRLLGELRDIVRVDVYRNRFCMLVQWRRVLATQLQGFAYHARIWLLDAERRDDAASRMASRVLKRLRSFKRHGLSGLLTGRQAS
jgi:hypothetical protein